MKGETVFNTTPVFTVSLFPKVYKFMILNNEKQWINAMTMDAPESTEDLAAVQKTVDSILGKGRDNKSIAQVVWNGDRNFWKEIYIDWGIDGKPLPPIKRPHLLYKTVFNAYDKFVRDVFVPRYIVLTRIEPEQYVEDWVEQVMFFCPERKVRVPYRPLTPPAEYFVWFKTIAHHNEYCCRKTARTGATCFGQYASPSAFIEESRQIRKGMEFSKLLEHSPFDSPDKIARKLRENQTNNYVDQSMRKFQESASHLLYEDPFSAVSEKTIANATSIRDIEKAASENLKRQGDMMEKVYTKVAETKNR